MLKTIGLSLIIIFILVAIIIPLGLAKLAKQSREMIPQLGLTDGRLAVCPNTPNCVNSQSSIEDKKINAITGGESAFKKIANHISSDATASIIKQSEHYLHVTYKSKLFGFIDDVELYLNGDVIDVRSASRAGKSDLGANRKRVEALRALVK